MRAYLAAILLLGACSLKTTEYTYEDDVDASVDADTVLQAGGQVTGMWNGAAVQLHLTANGGIDVLQTVDANGTFRFDQEMVDGVSFSVSVESQPTDHTCVVSNGNGTIEGADNLDALIECSGPPVAIAISAPIGFTFDDSLTEFDLDTSIVIQQTSFTVTAPTADSITLNQATALTNDVASPKISLAYGLNTATIDVTVGTLSRTYTFNVDRGAVDVAQHIYAKASNPDSGDRFGTSIAIDGDLMVVGAKLEWSGNGDPNDDSVANAGAAYVFHRIGGTWVQEGYLKGAERDVNDHFGWSVAISGDTVIVGEPDEDSAAVGVNGDAADDNLDSNGAAWIFRRNGGSWTQEAYLKPSIASATAQGFQFGHSVSISGNTAVVGARWEKSNATLVNGNQNDSSAGSAGAAYVFVRSGTTWSQQAYVKASNTEGGDEFGSSVAVSGDLLVVGARLEDGCGINVGGNQTSNGCSSAGAAYAYRRTGSTWAFEAYLKASNPEMTDLFGCSVAANGNVIAVGACTEDSADPTNPTDNFALEAGAVYAFRYNGAAWSPDGYLKANLPDSGAHFGTAVGVFGDLIAVGAESQDIGGQTFLFRHDGTNWLEPIGLTSANIGTGDKFGISVGLSSDGLAVAADSEDSASSGINPMDTGNLGESGAAYIFR